MAFLFASVQIHRCALERTLAAIQTSFKILPACHKGLFMFAETESLLMKVKFKLIYAYLLVLPVVVWLYNPFQLYFLNDDAIYIPHNENFFANQHFATRVLSDFSLFVDTWLYGKKAWGFHLTNLLLHFVCTGLVYFFTRKCAQAFKLSKPAETAALASFLFFIYAFHSEAVLWIIGRGGSLSTVFAGLSLLLYLMRFKSKWYYLLSLFFFAAGLLTYESVWILPGIVSLLAMLSKRGEGNKKELLYVSGYWAVFILFLMIRKLMEGTFAGTPYGASDAAVFSDISRYVYNFAALFLRTFLPPASTPIFIFSGFVLLATAITGAWFLFKHNLFSRFRIFIYACFLVSLLPYIMFGIDTHDSESERFLYLPSFFVCVILADLILLIRSSQLRLLVIVSLTLFHLFFLYRTAASFKQSSRIAKTTIESLQGIKEPFDRVYLVDVPSQYKGAYIFRIGFSYILKWLAPEVKYQQLVEVSSREIKIAVKDFSGFPVSRDSALVKQSWIYEKANALKKKEGDKTFLWTDSSFVIIH